MWSQALAGVQMWGVLEAGPGLCLLRSLPVLVIVRLKVTNVEKPEPAGQSRQSAC